MVIIWFSAILKKLVAVCGGWVMLAKPGGAVCAIEGALETLLEGGGGVGADAEPPDAPDAPDAPGGAPEAPDAPEGAEADMAASTENWCRRRTRQKSTATAHDVHTRRVGRVSHGFGNSTSFRLYSLHTYWSSQPGHKSDMVYVLFA
jgi:hypothetical protein